MNVIIINGPMGVGKTTVGTAIADKCPGTAFIDGDWCMDLHPFVGNSETKKMAIDNILHMVENYRKCSFCKLVVISWLMDDEWVVSALAAGIRKLGVIVETVTLICDETQLIKQWKEDLSCPWRTDEWLRNSIRSLDYFRNCENCFDTGGLSVEEVAGAIIKKYGCQG